MVQRNRAIRRQTQERELFNHYIHNIPELDAKLKKGAEKARIVAREVLGKVREKLGFK